MFYCQMFTRGARFAQRRLVLCLSRTPAAAPAPTLPTRPGVAGMRTKAGKATKERSLLGDLDVLTRWCAQAGILRRVGRKEQQEVGLDLHVLNILRLQQSWPERVGNRFVIALESCRVITCTITHR